MKQEKPAGFNEILCYHVAVGVPIEQISKEMGCSQTAINSIIKKEEYKKKIAEIRWRVYGENAKARFSGLVQKAITVVEEIMSNATGCKPEVRLSAAKEIFDRSLGRSTQQIEVGGSLFSDLIKSLDEIKRREAIDAQTFDITPAIEHKSEQEIVIPCIEIEKKEEKLSIFEKKDQENDAWIKENI